MSEGGLTVEECIERAVALLPEGDEPVVSDGTDEYALLLRKLCSHLRQWDETDEQFEEEHLELMIHQSLIRASDMDDAISAFHTDIRATLESTDTSRFRIVFPLNIRDNEGQNAPTSIGANITSILKMDVEDWHNIENEAQNSEETNSKNLSYNEFLDQAPDSITSARHNSFYAFETEARNSKIATSILNRDLDIIIGKLNFTAVDSGLDQTALDELRSLERSLPEAVFRPSVYHVLEDGDYDTFYTSYIPDSHTGLRLPNGFESDFEDLKDFPLEAASEEVDSNIANAFRALQAGLTATTNENAFLYYWRGLEEITLHDRESGSEDTLKRALPLVHEEFDLEVLESVTEDLAKKRNEIVHTGIESPVYVRDVNLLRRLLFLSINELYTLSRGEYSRTQILGILKRGLHAEGILENLEDEVRKERISKDDMLEEIDGARQWKRANGISYSIS